MLSAPLSRLWGTKPLDACDTDAWKQRLAAALLQFVCLLRPLAGTPGGWLVALRVGLANAAALCLPPLLTLARTIHTLATTPAPRRRSRRRWFPLARAFDVVDVGAGLRALVARDALSRGTRASAP